MPPDNSQLRQLPVGTRWKFLLRLLGQYGAGSQRRAALQVAVLDDFSQRRTSDLCGAESRDAALGGLRGAGVWGSRSVLLQIHQPRVADSGLAGPGRLARGSARPVR